MGGGQDPPPVPCGGNLRCRGGARFSWGRKEAPLYESLKERLAFPAVFPGCLFSLREFAALVSTLNVMVSGDSLAMHVAISQGVWSVALFGSTTEREIEFYGRGKPSWGKPAAPHAIEGPAQDRKNAFPGSRSTMCFPVFSAESVLGHAGPWNRR